MVLVQREQGLGRLEFCRRVVRIAALLAVKPDGVIVDRDGMVGDDELDVRVLGGNDFPHPFHPQRAVHVPHALHLVHQFVLVERGVVSLEPIQSLRGPQLLGVDVLE
jgi:hypothetical protein